MITLKRTQILFPSARKLPCCVDCFVRRFTHPCVCLWLGFFLLPLIAAEVNPVPKLKFHHHQDRGPGTSVPPKKTDISSSKSVNSNEIVESSSLRTILKDRTISFDNKIAFADETHLHAGRYYRLLSSLDRAE